MIVPDTLNHNNELPSQLSFAINAFELGFYVCTLNNSVVYYILNNCVLIAGLHIKNWSQVFECQRTSELYKTQDAKEVLENMYELEVS